MHSEWKLFHINDIAESMADAPFGSDLKSSDYTDQGVLVIQGKNIQGRVCDWSDRRYVSLEKYQRLTRSHCIPGDLVFPKVGTIGKVGILTPLDGQNKYILSTNTMRLRTNESIAHSLYVYYYFTLPEIQNLIQALNSKSVQPVFNYTSLKAFEIPLPPLPEQRAIAQILGSLDDKIELNRRMNTTLEATARALFQSWFVDFDPVHAKARGEQPSGMDAATAALFPDHFEDSHLGPIPAGWQVGKLEDIATVASGKRPEERNSEMSSEFSIPLFGGGGIMGFVRKALYDKVLLITGRVGTLGLVFRIKNPCWPSDNTLIVLSNSHDFYEYVFFRMQMIDYKSLNRGSTQPLLTQTDLKSQTLIVPPSNIIGAFHEYVEPLFANIDHNDDQSNDLAETRDALLPKLISGEVRVEK